MDALLAAAAEYAHMAGLMQVDPEQSAHYWPERITCRDCDVVWNRSSTTVCWCCGKEPTR